MRKHPGRPPSLYFLLAAGVPFVLSACRAGGDLKNEEHYVALESAEIAAELAATTAGSAPVPSASPSSAAAVGPPYGLLLTTPSTTTTSGSCAGPITLSLIDDKNQKSTAETGYAIALQDTLGGSFYGALSCATAITSTSIAVGASTSSVYFKSRASGTSTLSASNDQLVPGALALTVSPGSVASISLALPSTSSAAGTCSQMSYTFYDANGNVAPTEASRTASFQSSDPLGKIYTTSACSVSTSSVTHGAGVSAYTGLYYQGRTAASFTLIGSSSGIRSSTVVGTTTAGSGSWFVWSGSDSTTAASCTSLTLTAADTYGNVTTLGSTLPVSLAVTSGGAAYNDAVCSASTTSASIIAGQSSANVYFKSNTAGSYSITVSATGYSAASTAVVVSAGSSSDLALAYDLPIKAGDCNAITVQTKDAYGNLVTQTSTKSVSITGGGSGAFFSNSSCVTPASTVAVSGGLSASPSYYKSSITLVSGITIRASGLNQATAAITVVGNGTPTSLTLTGSGSLIKQDCGIYTLSLYDSAGNLSYNTSGASVSLSGGSDGTFHTASNCSGGSATTSASVAATSSYGTFYYIKSTDGTVTLAAGSSSITTGTRTVTMTTGTPVSMTLTGGDSSPIYTGYCSQSAYTLTLYDSFGNVTPVTSNQSLTFSNLSSGEVYLGWTCISMPASTIALTTGQSQAIYYLSGTKPESITYSVAGSGITSITGGARFITRFATVGGSYSGCSLLSSGRVKCTGYNGNAQLQLTAGAVYKGDTPDEMGVNLAYLNFGINRTVLRIASSMEGTGYSGHCAILDTHKIKCWGEGSNSMGYETAVDIGDAASEAGDSLAYVNLGTNRLAYRISNGYAGHCVITDTGAVKCFGFYDSSDLTYTQGYGDTLIRGKVAGTMGDYLPDVNLGTGFVAAEINCAYAHCCAVANDGRVKCWGAGSSGRTGYGDALFRGGGAGQMGNSLPYVSIGVDRTAKEVHPLAASTCMLLDNGKLRCFGDGGYGALLNGATGDVSDSSSEQGDNIPYSNLGANRTALLLATGSNNTNTTSRICALLDNGGIKCWGTGFYAGYGDNLTRGQSATTVGDSHPYVNLGTGRTVKIVSNSSQNRSCALLDTNEVKCWGYGATATLGYGDSMSRGYTNGQMGDCLPVVDFGEAASE